MNKWQVIVTCIAMVGFISSCKDKVDENLKAGAPVPIIDTENGKTDRVQIPLSTIADSVYYIKLSTGDSLFLSNDINVTFTNNYLLVLDINTRGVHLFDRKGKFIRQIGAIGEGPEEYLFPAHCIADEGNNNIMILDSKKKKILFYDFEGKFRQYIPVIGYPQKFYLIDSHFVYLTPSEGQGANDFPNIYKSDLKGTLVKEIKFAENYRQDRFSSFSSYMYKDTLVFWQQTNDTMYNINADLELSPRAVLKDKDLIPKKSLFNDADLKQKLSSHLIVDDILESNNHYFVLGIFKKEGLSIVNDKNTGKNINLIYHLDVMDHGFLNDIDGGIPFIPVYQVNEKCFYNVMPSIRFLKVYNNPYTRSIVPKNKHLRETLVNFSKTLQPDGDLVIQVVNLK